MQKPQLYLFRLVSLLGFCFSLVGCSYLPSTRLPSPDGNGSEPDPQPEEEQLSISDSSVQIPLLGSLQGDFVIAAVEKVGPAVVRIDTMKKQESLPFFPEDSSFNRNFPQGQGSGLITRSDGIVITNHHVLEAADTVVVTLRDGRTYQGQVLGTDVVTDLGIVKVDTDEVLPVATLGDSDRVRTGEWAIAIGNPLGLNNSVSLGIVSATDRTAGVPGGSRVSYIQTDAAINPGNSGGPLINDHGQVIGINTFIRTSPGGGISFAIPINKARKIGEEIIAYGRASHPFIGLSLRRITPELAGEINQEGTGCSYPETNGVAVVDVLAGKPAEQAGLQPCDVIRSVGGVEVNTPAQVQVQVDRGQVGQPMELVIERKKMSRIFEVVPMELGMEPF